MFILDFLELGVGEPYATPIDFIVSDAVAADKHEDIIPTAFVAMSIELTIQSLGTILHSLLITPALQWLNP